MEENKIEETAEEEATELNLITLMIKKENEYTTLLHILILALIILVAVALFTLYGQYKTLCELIISWMETSIAPLPASIVTGTRVL